MKEKVTVFLSVGTLEQKCLCERFIKENRSNYDEDIIVVVDGEDGYRMGSGGAVLRILSEYYEPGSKMAIINSGGMSKRSVNYAVKGKAFANVLYKGEEISLFELIYMNAKKLLSCFGSGALICCADIPFDASAVCENFDSNTGFCIASDFETASRHGVMFCNEDGYMSEYPHKCSVEMLKDLCSAYNTELPLADTGTVYFTDDFCLRLADTAKSLSIIEKLIRNNEELGLYTDIIPLLSEKCNEKTYLDGGVSGATAEIRKRLFDSLKNFSLRVYSLKNQPFRHFGSMGEALKNIFDLSGCKDNVLINSYTEKSVIGKNTVLDNVVLKKNCRIGDRCIVSDITLDEGTVIDDNRVVCGIKLNDGSFVTVICDIDENPKELVNSKELWEQERFYKGFSYSDSLNKYTSSADEIKYSLKYCVENADVKYFFTRSQYIKELREATANNEYLKIREKIINKYFEKVSTRKNVACVSDKVEVNLPLRINMSGTWTDAMPYCIDNGGQVINMAILVEGKKPVTVTVERLDEKVIEFGSDGVTAAFDFENHKSGEADLSDFNLHIAALKTVGITKDTVLNDGFRLTTLVEGIDKGSGLGVSSILLGGCIIALGRMFGKEYDSAQVLKMVFVAEQIMGTGGGWQDQVGGLLPSIKAGTTVPGIEQDLQIEYIDIHHSLQKVFDERLVIIPTGQRHFGRFIVSDVADRYLSANEDSLCGHREIRELNTELTESLEKGSYTEYCGCINRHFELLKKISPLVSNDKIDALISDCRQEIADGVSVCGAGGGGYLFAVLKDGVTASDVQAFISRKYPYITSEVKKIRMSEDKLTGG